VHAFQTDINRMIEVLEEKEGKLKDKK